MPRNRPDKVSVRWVDAKTGEDVTERMNDPSAAPGEGILKVAAAIGRRMAAQQIEAERRLQKDLEVERATGADPDSFQARPEPGDEVALQGVSYRYDGAAGDGEHFTRLRGDGWPEALVSLRRGSAAAD